jgi:hypothetical protein
MSTRKRRKYISSLKRSDGTLSWDHTEKEDILQNYFSAIMGKKVPRERTFDWDRLGMCTIQEIPGLELDRPFSENEIERAVMSLPNDRAPGPDGFTNNFYKHCWTIMKPDIVNAFHSIHVHHCGALEYVNNAHVVMIPKVDVANEPKHFRPISLIHSFAKLFTKVLAVRLSVYIEKLISTSQSAFIRKRCIQDNFVYVRGLARHYHRTKTSACLIKLDISKAFDTVSWEYLLEMLRHRGFSTRWTDWLARILSSSSSAVLVNGCPGPVIKHRRGLRQGDPLSSYLFILAMDTLNRIFDIATEEGSLSPLKGRQARLRLSLYADDAVIFTNPKREDINGIMQIMEAFGDATGLRINMEKSTVAPIRCDSVDLDDALRDFAGARVHFLVKYLGLPLTLGRLKMVHLQYIQDRAKGKIEGWQGRLVTLAGRRELVRSVLSLQPVYLVTALKPPKGFFKETDKLRKKFLWARDGELTGGKCKVAWPTVCKPAVNGGLGIKDLEMFSRSLRLRWMWYSCDSKERPWKDTEIPVDSDDLKLFNAATTVELGNGRKAAFWTSAWLQGEVPAALFPALYKHSKRKNRTVCDALTDNKWIKDIDYNMTQQIIAEFLSLWDRLHDIALYETQEDKITWRFTADGQYSTRSAYALQLEGTTRCRTATLTWKSKAPPKSRFFLWLLLKNRIWTAARLQQRGWPNDYFCQLCTRNMETSAHLFMECGVTKSIWKRVADWIGAPNLAPENWLQTESLQDWILHMTDGLQQSSREALKSLIILVIWEIWRERNNRIFRQVRRSIHQILSDIQDAAKTWAYAGNKGLQRLLTAHFDVPGRQAVHSVVFVSTNM